MVWSQSVYQTGSFDIGEGSDAYLCVAVSQVMMYSSLDSDT